MPRPSAPSMPTARQIQEAHETVCALYPAARIARVGPEGVTFDYPEASAGDARYANLPFGPA